jgi:hypothetical protein
LHLDMRNNVVYYTQRTCFENVYLIGVRLSTLTRISRQSVVRKQYSSLCIEKKKKGNEVNGKIYVVQGGLLLC